MFYCSVPILGIGILDIFVGLDGDCNSFIDEGGDNLDFSYVLLT